MYLQLYVELGDKMITKKISTKTIKLLHNHYVRPQHLKRVKDWKINIRTHNKSTLWVQFHVFSLRYHVS